ncbi:MAG: hypothetical protein MMC23_005977, partial [Stictis urceolatum]|nr:hypothetical protein [Stictis urceolata]
SHSMRTFLNVPPSRLEGAITHGATIRQFPSLPPPRAGTSMLASGNPSLAALTYSTATVSSRGSVATPTAGSSGRILEPDSAGALQIRPIRSPPVYECPFDFLNCGRHFSSYNDWVQHSLTHFGSHSPSMQNECRFCDIVIEQRDGRQSWKKFMEHMELHFRLGHGMRHARPAFNLYRHLWKEDIIDQVLFKSLMGSSDSLSTLAGDDGRGQSGPSSGGDYYMVTNDNRRRRR